MATAAKVEWGARTPHGSVKHALRSEWVDIFVREIREIKRRMRQVWWPAQA
jgi:hypothetical protein